MMGMTVAVNKLLHDLSYITALKDLVYYQR